MKFSSHISKIFNGASKLMEKRGKNGAFITGLELKTKKRKGQQHVRLFYPVLLRYLLEINFIPCFLKYLSEKGPFHPVLFEVSFRKRCILSSAFYLGIFWKSILSSAFKCIFWKSVLSSVFKVSFGNPFY